MDAALFFAGLGLFLFGMSQIEEGLREVAGSGFRHFIRRHTSTPLRGILTGTFSTAVLQSSSIVTLMVIAFAGAGVLELKQALGVVIGSNLGTTFTGWIVTTLGFKVRFELLAQALIAVAGLVFVLMKTKRQTREGARVAIGLGLLLYGLGWMKTAMEAFAMGFDVSPFSGLPYPVVALVGVGLTALIQSSSASMMIGLTALNAGLLSLPHAAAFVIGADLGTTFTGILGALGGGPEEKRVAASHVVYNVATDLVALALLPTLLSVFPMIGMTDALYTLVAFHSTFNLLGIFLFLPFLQPFAAFMNRRFVPEDRIEWEAFRTVPVEEIETALEVLEQAAHEGLARAVRLVGEAIPVSEALLSDWRSVEKEKGWPSRYASLKKLEGEAVAFSMRVQGGAVSEAGLSQILRMQRVLRESVLASKALKDLAHDLERFRVYEGGGGEWWKWFEEHLERWFSDLQPFADAKTALGSLGQLAALVERAKAFHDATHERLLSDASLGGLEKWELSTLLNCNREVVVSCESLTEAVGQRWSLTRPWVDR